MLRCYRVWCCPRAAATAPPHSHAPDVFSVTTRHHPAPGFVYEHGPFTMAFKGGKDAAGRVRQVRQLPGPESALPSCSFRGPAWRCDVGCYVAQHAGGLASCFHSRLCSMACQAGAGADRQPAQLERGGQRAVRGFSCGRGHELCRCVLPFCLRLCLGSVGRPGQVEPAGCWCSQALSQPASPEHSGRAWCWRVLQTTAIAHQPFTLSVLPSHSAETAEDRHTNDTQTAADMNTLLRRWFAEFSEFKVLACLHCVMTCAQLAVCWGGH